LIFCNNQHHLHTFQPDGEVRLILFFQKQAQGKFLMGVLGKGNGAGFWTTGC
jgi:hypothetical protein